MEAVTATAQAPALDSPELFVNREVSWLQFNERVLELAEDERMPLLERVKFLAIYANNLDEFFMVRVAGLHDQVDAGIDARGPDGLSARETLERINERNAELDAPALACLGGGGAPGARRARRAGGRGPGRAPARSSRRSTGCSRSRSSRC